MNEAVQTALEKHALTREAVEAVVEATRRDASAAMARSLEEELAAVEIRHAQRLMHAAARV
jgi:hypothetical protein